MNWLNLSKNKCPQCGKPLQSSLLGDVIACADNLKCPFTISQEKMSRIVMDQSSPKRRKVFRDNLKDLNNLKI